MNIIELLGITYKEDIISNLLVGLINESKKFRMSFLENIIGIVNPSLYKAKAHTRIGTTQGIPDIIITVENENESILIIVENKLKAEEGYEQTKRYADEKCIKELCSNPKIGFENRIIKENLLFLTLIPETIPTSEKFINVTYKDLIEKVNVEVEDVLLNRIYKDFSIIMKEFYNGLDVTGESKLIEILYDEVENEKVYIRFRNVMKHFKSTNDLRVKFIGKTGGKGRVNFIAKISKDDWIGKDEAIFIENNYSIGSETFDIHFEGTFDIFSGSITLPLHYEPRPYIPKNKLIRYSNEEDYEKYLNKREKIKEIIHNEIIKLNDPNVKTYNGSNQIASINIDIESNTTVNEFIEAMTLNIDKLSVIVDKALKEVMR